MWMRKSKTKTTASEDAHPDIHIVMPEAALTAVFDECDQFTDDETGGRVIGTYTEEKGRLNIHVTGMIESGPSARRSRVSFFQDGPYQERLFRQIEAQHPEIEHLGNWHTHHVNGLPHLSGGDLATYHRTVNHKNHNTSFFYALLVTAKNETRNPRDRYTVKHYVFRRDDENFYEVPAGNVRIVNAPLVWPSASLVQPAKHTSSSAEIDLGARPERVQDRAVLGEFYKSFRAFGSQKLGFYWRGPLELLDGSAFEVVLLEDQSARSPAYTVTLREPADVLKRAAEKLAKREFPSARMALITTERELNRALFEQGASRKS
jgi:hypothetical protein